jgi:hypothetical protein
MTNQIELATRDALDVDIRALPHADPRREAWLSTDSFSSQWIHAWPSKRDALTALKFGEVFTTYLGVESPAVRLLAGRPIPHPFHLPAGRPPMRRAWPQSRPRDALGAVPH